MGRQLFEYHPRIGYRFIPGITARVVHEAGGYFVRTNQAGFRSDTEFDSKKRSGKKRILLFGDSYTAGEGVTNAQRYSDLLSQWIPNLEIYNFALPGTGTDQQYLTYQEYAHNIEHDLLIIAVLVENIRRNVAHYRIYQDEKGEPLCYAKPFYELIDAKPVLKNVPPSRQPIKEPDLPASERKQVEKGGRLPWLRNTIRRMGLKEVTQKITRYQPFPEYNHPKAPEWQLMRAILTEWISKHPTPVMLMPIPFYSYIEGTANAAQMQKRFRELADELSCILFDPLDALKQYPLAERRQFRFKHDIHPTPVGHNALAKALMPSIKEIL